MIEWIRKHMGWMMWIIVGLVTVTFLFFGIYPSSMSGRAVAKVGGVVITSDEVNRVYRNLYDTYKDVLKDKFNESVEKSLRNQALQELIVNRLFIEEAKNMGLQVADQELQANIVKMPGFSRDGRFDKQAYERILERINMTPAVFEANQREFLLRQKVEQLVRDSVTVEDAELSAVYQQRNPKAKPGDFEKNKDTFRQTYLAEKQRNALTVFLRNAQTRIPVKIEDKTFAAS
jgi:peptidyl-prolyl cis-trans isomerase D